MGGGRRVIIVFPLVTTPEAVSRRASIGAYEEDDLGQISFR